MTLFLLNYVTTKPNLSLFTYFGCLLVAGNFAAININISHELMHKNNKLDQFFGMLTLSKNLYMHFFIEHVQGHHKNVATPSDPASSKFGQTYYEFLPQTLIGTLKSSWNYETKRLLEIKKLKSVWVPQNRMLYFGLNNLILPLIIFKFWGFIGAFFFVGTAAIGIALLEVINYIEHYGLRRKEISPGIYEKVNIYHSWNTPHRFSNYVLFKLQRHSDHHENGYKPYQILTSFDESPQMPHGYSVCLLLATVPSAWFKVMNEYVLTYNQKKVVTPKLSQRMHRDIMQFIGVVFVITSTLMILGFRH
jgi:alkane 1-monooxygenase